MSDPKHALVSVVEHQAPVARMHPLVQSAMAQSPDPATLRELLQLQRDWEAGEALKAFTRAKVALKADLPAVIARDQRVAFRDVRYTHTSLASAMDAVMPILTRHGFSLDWQPSTEKGQVTVTCRLTHAEGHSESCSITAPVDTSGSKSPAQGTASTITLLQRYTALSLLGIATADMKDPAGPPPADAVDTSRNMKAAAAVKKAGKVLADAESFIGRSVQEWTAADLERLRAWLKPTERQPGDEG
jgi:hypothetical protein